MAKNSIFSGKDTKGRQKAPEDRSKGYKSQYYGSGSTAAQKRKQQAIDATKRYREAGLGKEDTKQARKTRFALIMEAMPKNQRDMLRNKVDNDGYYSSGDLLDAAEEIAQEVEGVKYFSKYQLDQKLAELKARNASIVDEVDSAIDDAIDLTPF